MIQFLADQLDQLDLALDQLALKDRNFDRFALMLIDNAVELTLHEHAQDIRRDAELYPPDDGPRCDPKLVTAALGPYFDAKIKLARTTGLVIGELADTIQYLHGFRNSAYHRGARHDGILHALALFYARSACQLLAKYEPLFWSTSGRDSIPHRAVKYLGSVKSVSPREAFKLAWERLGDVAAHHGDTLIDDLHSDMARTIDLADEQVTFLAQHPEPNGTPRDQVVIDCLLWPIAFSDEGEKYAAAHGGPVPMTPEYLTWIAQNYPWPVRTDPIPSWRNRAPISHITLIATGEWNSMGARTRPSFSRWRLR
ncbi:MULTISPECIES: hypothetical protein [Burkholderia]|uniref:hypothetical protein n=1 Tax=Burkholderia TaxID=32008 RepID=UPI0007556E3A|nr:MULTISPECIES: hypothetical protein [Burkholderia]AOJ72149.1 hypothetical protein WS78_25760 [Burkholderia savannae]KVG42628.1 hypothetical protein WS77_00060 [Burkholderia sp. MSMB0265]KVG97226.1 hypothetical protein WS83_31465 [Burkholderia sp. MSMB2042]KVG98918.1 hypothetical protein WS82_25805 [Burkholderia sp. MSMB2041]